MWIQNGNQGTHKFQGTYFTAISTHSMSVLLKQSNQIIMCWIHSSDDRITKRSQKFCRETSGEVATWKTNEMEW
jgi:hypothetical protein